MRRFNFLAGLLALALVAPAATNVLASGKGTTHKTATTSVCPAGASTAIFTDRFGTGKAAFKTRAACASFLARNRTIANLTVTPTTTFMPATTLPSTTTALRLRGNSLSARTACPVRHDFTLAFTNNAPTVNGQPLTTTGQTISIMQLSQSATTVLAGTHTFANHGGCVSFFATNRHLFILTMQH